MFRSMETRSDVAVKTVLAVAVVVVLLPACPAFNVIPTRDSGVFLYIGQRMLRGDVPYKDVWDHKTPLIYLINALGLTIGKGRLYGVWFLEFVFVFAAMFLGYKLVSEVFGVWPARMSSIAWVANLSLVLEGGNFTEEYAIAFQFAAYFAFWRWLGAGKRWAWAYVFGFMTSCSFLLRPNLAGVYFAGIGVVLVRYAVGYVNLDDLSAFCTASLVGFVTALVPMAAYFSANSAITQLWDAVFLYNVYYSSTNMRERLLSILMGVGLFSGYAVLSIGGWWGGLIRLARRSWPGDPLSGFLMLVLFDFPIELLASAVSGQSYAHYYMAWLPVLCLLHAFFLFSFGDALRRDAVGESVIVIVMLILSAVVLLTPVRYYEGSRPRQMPGTLDLIAYIKACTTEDDTILVWGAETVFNYMTDRASPTVYVYQYPLYTRGYQNDQMVVRFLSDLRKQRPLLIVDTSATNPKIPPIERVRRAEWRSPDIARFNLLPSMGSVFRFIEENYYPVRRLQIGAGVWVVYRRADHAQ